jgi:acyl-CoA thioesterase I
MVNDPKRSLAIASFALLAGCSSWDATDTPPGPAAGASGAGNASGTGGGSGSAGASGTSGSSTGGATCRASELGRVSAPSPLISVGKRVATSEGVTNPAVVVDGRYHGSAATILPVPTEDEPSFVSIEIGAGPERLLLIWTDAGWTPYNVLSGGAPTSYRIETSGDSTDGIDGTWDIAVPEKQNAVRSRGDTFPFAGKSWVRFVPTSVMDGAPSVRLDEIAVHDVSSAGATERPSDTWFFMGDSITQGGLQREFGDDSVDAKVHEALPDYYPAVINGGIGGELTSQGIAHLTSWLDEANPDFSHVGIMYGTNDSWGNKDPVSAGFQTQLETLVDRVLAAGRVPFVATIPYSSSMVHDTLPAWNAVIETVVTERGLPCGPDFYTWFLEHPEDLSSDGVHPNTSGYRNMNALWAETMKGYYPAE